MAKYTQDELDIELQELQEELEEEKEKAYLRRRGRRERR